MPIKKDKITKPAEAEQTSAEIDMIEKSDDTEEYQPLPKLKRNPALYRLDNKLCGKAVCVGCGSQLKFHEFYPSYTLFGKMRTVEYKRNKSEKDGGKLVTTIKQVSCLCKDCTRKLYEKITEENGGDKKAALFRICLLEGYYFDNDVVEELIANGQDAEFPDSYLNIVCASYNSEEKMKYRGKSLQDQIELEDFCCGFKEKEKEVMTFSEEDKKNRSAVIACFVDDPFKDDPLETQPKSYRDLNNMIDETMATDPVRQSAAIQVVTLIRQTDNCAARIKELNEKLIHPSDDGKEQMSDEQITDAITSWTGIMKTNQAIMQNICKDNGFTLKFKVGASKASGTLSDMMREMDLRNYDKGKINFYDISTSKSLGEVAKINITNIQNQLRLTDQEYSEMVAEQSETIQKLQKELADTKEALRLIKYQEIKQELLEEYKIHLKDKGISEDEIMSLMGVEIDKRVKGDKK